jgi:hypothetical protein
VDFIFSVGQAFTVFHTGEVATEVVVAVAAVPVLLVAAIAVALGASLKIGAAVSV